MILLGFWAGCSRAQDGHHGAGHAEVHDWYKGLRAPHTGASCCDDRDCRPTRAYREDDGTWRAMLDGQWVAIPIHVVLKEKAPDGRSHICANPDTKVIYCFIAGEPRS